MRALKLIAETVFYVLAFVVVVNAFKYLLNY